MKDRTFAIGEFYHVFNRGTDKRDIFLDSSDLVRFVESIKFFNSIIPVGSIRNLKDSFSQTSDVWERSKLAELVNIVCFCLNPNHYHLLLSQKIENGVSEFIKRLSGGYTKFFNEKYERNGVLFQGKYKAIHISSNDYLLHLSSYINLNNRIGESCFKLSKSSWEEFVCSEKVAENLCGEKGIILEQFRDKEDYKIFALDALKDITERKKRDKDYSSLFLE